MQAAVDGRRKEIVELLIAEGADVNARPRTRSPGLIMGTALDRAIIDKHPEIADLLRKHGGNTSEEIETLLDAALNGDIEAVKQCLAAGVDVNAKADFRGVTPLHDAASNGRKEVVELLLANGADILCAGPAYDL